MSAQPEHNVTVAEQHRRQAEAYARLVADLPSERSARFRALVPTSPDDRVIDVACGPGLLSLEMAPHVAEIVGIDLTPQMLIKAQKLQAAAGVWNIRWVIGDATALPFGDATFSLAICSGAFHHFEDPVGVLCEMMRVCQPGGRIVINDVTPGPDKAPAYDRIETLRDPSHRHAHSVAELRALGREAGLVEIHVDTSPTSDIPFDAVLSTSEPVELSREEIHALVAEDARSGEDRYGYNAHFVESRLMANFVTTILVWRRP